MRKLCNRTVCYKYCPNCGYDLRGDEDFTSCSEDALDRLRYSSEDNLTRCENKVREEAQGGIKIVADIIARKKHKARKK